MQTVGGMARVAVTALALVVGGSGSVAADLTTSTGARGKPAILAMCPGEGVRELRLLRPIAVDGFLVELRGHRAGLQAGTTVTVSAGRFQRSLRATDSHVLRF